MKYIVIVFTLFSFHLCAGLLPKITGASSNKAGASFQTVEDWVFNFDEHYLGSTSDLASPETNKVTEHKGLLDEDKTIYPTKCCSCTVIVFIAVWRYCIGRRDVEG